MSMIAIRRNPREAALFPWMIPWKGLFIDLVQNWFYNPKAVSKYIYMSCIAKKKDII